MMAFDLERATVQIPSHVRATLGADGGVLLDLDRGVYLSLNRAGGRIWAGLASGTSAAAIAAELAQSCKVEEARVRDDVVQFLATLQEKGLVVVG